MVWMMPVMRDGKTAVVLATLAMTAVAVFGGAMLSPSARGQDKVPGLTGIDRSDEVIQARQLLMDGIETEMAGVELGLEAKQIQLEDLKLHADRISTLLAAFPHLFPPQTKPAVGADGSPSPTTATLAIWQDFDAFYGKAQAAAMTAYDTSQAADLDAFRAQAKKLRVACDSCHAQYMHVEPPQQ
jgi:cytochrome c556